MSMSMKESTKRIRGQIPKVHPWLHLMRKVPWIMASKRARTNAPTTPSSCLDTRSILLELRGWAKLTAIVRAATQLQAWEVSQHFNPLCQRQESEKRFEMLLYQQGKAHRAFQLRRQLPLLHKWWSSWPQCLHLVWNALCPVPILSTSQVLLIARLYCPNRWWRALHVPSCALCGFCGPRRLYFLHVVIILLQLIAQLFEHAPESKSRSRGCWSSSRAVSYPLLAIFAMTPEY